MLRTFVLSCFLAFATCVANAQFPAPGGMSSGTGGGSSAGVPSAGNITPVTANGNVTSDQALQEIALPAGYLNTLKQQTIFNSSGIFTIAVAQTPTLTFKVKLCTISGCGSGTVVTLASIATAATVAATNNPWNMTLSAGTSAIGASGTLIVHGFASVDIGALSTTAETVYNDANTDLSSTIDLTAALFVDWTVTTSSGNAGNTFTEQNAGVMAPGGSPVSSVNAKTGTVALTLNSADFVNEGTTVTLLHGNAAGNPAFGSVVNADIAAATIDLTAKVANALPVTNGGTALATLTAHALYVGNGASAPNAVGLGSTTTLLHGNAAGDPTFGSVVNADIAAATIDLTAKVVNALPVANGGTALATLTAHALYVGNGASAPNAVGLGSTTTLLHGNAAGDPTFGAVATGDLAANAVTSAKMAVVNTRRVCDIPVNDTTGSAITNGQLGPQSRICFIPAAATVVEMDVNADAGTPNVIVGVNHAGSISNIVSGALATAASGGIACSNTGGTTGINGATTCSGTLQNTTLAAGDYLELVSGTAGGTAKFFVVHVVYTVN